MNSTLILLSHGSRNKSEHIKKLIDQIQSKNIFKNLQLAFLEWEDPSLNHVLKKTPYPTRIGILSLFFVSSGHYLNDIPDIIQKSPLHPNQNIQISPPLVRLENFKKALALQLENELKKTTDIPKHIILATRGTASPKAAEDYSQLLHFFERSFTDIKFSISHYSLAEPFLSEFLENLNETTWIYPLLIERGRIYQSIESLCQKANKKFPMTQLRLLPPLGEYEQFEDLIIELLKELDQKLQSKVS